jgi:hypothetical protein
MNAKQQREMEGFPLFTSLKMSHMTEHILVENLQEIFILIS